MPSPVGHSLGAIAAGWLAARPAASRAALGKQTAILAAIGLAPDLDLLIGRHSMETHSIGAALAVGAVAAWARWPLAATGWGTFLAAGCAWLSHPILDMLALDTTAPLGVMFLWPLTTEHMQTGWSVFAAISRRYWVEGFVAYTAWAVLRELLLLTPVLWLVWRTRRPPVEPA
jgi:inner membrane protein